MLVRVGLAGLAAIILCTGCGGSAASVSGNVTYNGQPIEDGTISFRPADGKSKVFAAKITNGSYNVPEAEPGSRIVAIRGTKKVNHGRSSEEAARLANEAKAAGKAWGGHMSEASDYIPEDAQGNNTTVDVASGDQTLNFEVTGPPQE